MSVMDSSNTEPKAVNLLSNKEMAVWSFRVPRNANASMDYLKQIGILHVNGPIRDASNGRWLVDVLYHGQPHRVNVYEEDLFSLFTRCDLPKIHQYVVSNINIWPSGFKSDFISKSCKENELLYDINDVLYQDNKYYHITWIAPSTQRWYLPNYRDSLLLYGGRCINVDESCKVYSLKYENDAVITFGNYGNSLVYSARNINNNNNNNNNAYASIIHIQNHKNIIYWKNTLKTVFRNSRGSLKISNTGDRYDKTYYIPSRLITDYILPKIHHDKISIKGTTRTFIMEVDEAESVFGGTYWSKRIGDEEVYLMNIQFEIQLGSGRTRIKGYIVRDDENGNTFGTESIPTIQQDENEKEDESNNENKTSNKATRRSKRLQQLEHS